jgi:hypothetical protein
MEIWTSTSYCDIRHKDAELLAIRAVRTELPRKFLGTLFCWRLRGRQGYWMWAEGIDHLKIEPGTSRLMAQFLNQLGQSCPHIYLSTNQFHGIRSSWQASIDTYS